MILLRRERGNEKVMCDVLSALPSITVFDKNNLRVQFALERDPADPLTLNITLTAVNGSAVAIHDFVFQAAVPKVKD